MPSSAARAPGTELALRLVIGGLISGAAFRDDREGGIERPVAYSSLLKLSDRGRCRRSWPGSRPLNGLGILGYSRVGWPSVTFFFVSLCLIAS